MKLKVFLVLVFIAILGVTASSYFRKRVGDVWPAILPPQKDISEIRENKPEVVGETVNFPLKLPDGYKISVFAKNLGNARDLEFSPGGTLLVSIPASGEVLALPGNQSVLTKLNKPHGLAFFEGKLFVAEETRIVRYLWDEEKLTATQDKILFSLPKGGRHFTRTVAFNKRGEMFISIGSTCNTCFERNSWHGSIIVSDKDGKSPRVYAKGLRNSVFITVDPMTDELWGTEMGRDFLGDDKPPDEINIIQDGKDYGWPVCFGNKVYDTKFRQKDSSYCNSTEVPIYEIQAHSAPLGLTFTKEGDLLVAHHGSWNRSTPIGYKIVRLKIENDKVIREEDFISGFLQGSQVLGRPVDLIFDKNQNLFISDDKTGVIYVVSYAEK